MNVKNSFENSENSTASTLVYICQTQSLNCLELRNKQMLFHVQKCAKCEILSFIFKFHR